MAEVRNCCDEGGLNASGIAQWYARVLTERAGLEAAWWNASETVRGRQLRLFWHGLRRETHLSLQLPGWPTVPVQRMIILFDREGPLQKSPPVTGQAKESVVGLLFPEMN